MSMCLTSFEKNKYYSFLLPEEKKLTYEEQESLIIDRIFYVKSVKIEMVYSKKIMKYSSSIEKYIGSKNHKIRYFNELDNEIEIDMDICFEVKNREHIAKYLEKMIF